MKKRFFDHKDLHGQVLELVRRIENSKWRPDYVVGITRGGLFPAVMLSHWFGVPCETLKVSLRDGGVSESNAWMADDAFGYDQTTVGTDESRSNPILRKNILVVDDINDSGDTISWIKNDWQSGCCPDHPDWQDIWHGNVRFAVLVENLASKAYVDYAASEVNKSEDDTWLVFPWEDWWKGRPSLN